MSQKIIPLAAIPSTGPDGVVAGSQATLPPSEFIWLAGRVSAGTVGLRPFYWEAEAASTTGFGGAWIPLGGDAVAGSSPVSFNSATFGGCANGRYINRRQQAIFVVVKENDVGSTFDFVHIGAELSTVGQ